ncbi:MAG: NAD-dependent epimerase/dehydratase family protein [Bacteroidia bacterium]|jgi:UDP-glucose 4-epimerase|nr:NAD-dependent epimerase/dehydratase family protein [Bacteroidia bacterium]
MTSLAGYKRHILITGGAGFVASSLAERLASDTGNFVVLVDNLLTGSLAKVPILPNLRFIKCDVNEWQDISGVFYGYRFDYVFHYAAVVGVKRTLENPVLVLRDLDGIRNILTLCKNTGVKRVFYSSSSEVYGEPVELPQNEETTPLNSRLPYAIVKNVGEAFLKSFRQEFGLQYTIFRFFNTYGPKQSPDFVISRFIQRALKNEPITINGDGTQTRTFCYVDDNTEACVSAFYNDRYIDDVVNIGSDVEISIADLARLIISITGSKSEIQYGPALPEGDMTRRMPDTSKMRQLLSHPPVSLEDGIRRILSNTRYIL